MNNIQKFKKVTKYKSNTINIIGTLIINSMCSLGIFTFLLGEFYGWNNVGQTTLIIFAIIFLITPFITTYMIYTIEREVYWIEKDQEED